MQEHNPAKTTGPLQSLREVFEWGAIPFAIVAVGLIAYGVYQLINARYRRIVVA